MLNPLSAIKLSPLSRSSMRPLSWTILRSFELPDHSLEMKVKAPQGAIPTNNLSVLWCLWSLDVAFCAHGEVGFSMKKSVASMITLVSGYFLNDFGNCRSSRVGQGIKVPLKIFASKYTHVVTILQFYKWRPRKHQTCLLDVSLGHLNAVCKVPRDTLPSQ